MVAVSRPHEGASPARLTTVPKSVDAEDGESAGRRSGRVDLFFQCSHREKPTSCRPRRSVSSIRHPRLFLSSASLPGRVSHFVTLHESSIPLSIGPAYTSGSHVYVIIIDDTYTCTGRPTQRFTHALIRGWWEEADARRRGARTWCAKIYGTGVLVCEDTLYVQASYTCACVVAGNARLSCGWTCCVAVT
jgi:hypothetical protein